MISFRVQIAIGPYEVKEDTFAGLKAAFEAFVYVTNLPEEQVKCPCISDYSNELCRKLSMEL